MTGDGLGDLGACQLPGILLWIDRRFPLHILQPYDLRADYPLAAPQKDANMSIEQFIDNEVKSNDVVLFMKGTPQFPQCGFSGQVVQILDHVGVGYKGLNVLESDDLRNGIKAY